MALASLALLICAADASAALVRFEFAAEILHQDPFGDVSPEPFNMKDWEFRQITGHFVVDASVPTAQPSPLTRWQSLREFSITTLQRDFDLAQTNYFNVFNAPEFGYDTDGIEVYATLAGVETERFVRILGWYDPSTFSTTDVPTSVPSSNRAFSIHISTHRYDNDLPGMGSARRDYRGRGYLTAVRALPDPEPVPEPGGFVMIGIAAAAALRKRL